MTRYEATRFYFGDDLDSAACPGLLRFRELALKKATEEVSTLERREMGRLTQDISERVPGFGRPAVMGKRVRRADGCEGEVDRVDLGTGALIVWFGEVSEHGSMRLTETVPCETCELA